MQLATRPPIKRHPREAFDYHTLFNGSAWRVEREDMGGRSPEQSYNLIRQAAWRRGLRAFVEFDGDALIVQAQRIGATRNG